MYYVCNSVAVSVMACHAGQWDSFPGLDMSFPNAVTNPPKSRKDRKWSTRNYRKWWTGNGQPEMTRYGEPEMTDWK